MATRTLSSRTRRCLAVTQKIAANQNPSWWALERGVNPPNAIFFPDSLLPPTSVATMQQEIFKPPLILIVEDDFRQAAILAAMIESQDKKVDITIAENLAEGWKQIKSNYFDLVLCDMELPERGEGIALIQCARNHPDSKNHSTKIIAMSSNISVYQSRCEEVGVEQAVSKPVSADKIKEWTEKPSSQAMK